MSRIIQVLIIDLGLSNIGSVYSAVSRALPIAQIDIRTDPELIINHPTHIILPGVGTFYQGSSRLYDRCWVEYLESTLNSPNSSTYFLGICLGMQLLASDGSEGCISLLSPGLDLIPSTVCKLYDDNSHHQGFSTHIGWNSLSSVEENIPLLENIPSFADFYYLHSYAFKLPSTSSFVAATCDFHDVTFPSIVSSNNIYGVQFHPEKSQEFGRILFRNFLDLC